MESGWRRASDRLQGGFRGGVASLLEADLRELGHGSGVSLPGALASWKQFENLPIKVGFF
jgi:hypothetical protein